MLRASREPTGEDPSLLPKMILFLAGAAFGMFGMLTRTDWPVVVGILLLLVGVVLRFVTRRVNPPGPPPNNE